MRALSGELLGPVAATVLVALLVALVTPRFLDAQNLQNFALRVAIVAIGSTIVIIAAGIDLNAVPISLQSIVISAIILLAVGLDMWRPELARLLRREGTAR